MSLVEMATGTGKTRTAAAFIKRLFEANAVTRVLFLVDRNTLAKQTEDAFARSICPTTLRYRLQSGRRFPRMRSVLRSRSLQSMINIYRDYSDRIFCIWSFQMSATGVSTGNGAACLITLMGSK